jgi:hypothetical protein
VTSLLRFSADFFLNRPPPASRVPVDLGSLFALPARCRLQMRAVAVLLCVVACCALVGAQNSDLITSLPGAPAVRCELCLLGCVQLRDISAALPCTCRPPSLACQSSALTWTLFICSFNQYAGYLTVNSTNGRALFYCTISLPPSLCPARYRDIVVDIGSDSGSSLEALPCCVPAGFVESQNNPATDPLVLWLNGGPGELSRFAMLLTSLAGFMEMRPGGGVVVSACSDAPNGSFAAACRSSCFHSFAASV